MGKRIREEQDLERKEIYGKKILSDLSKSLEIGERTIYRAIQAYDKFPELDKIPDGKNISWNKLITLYLPELKKPDTPELPKGKYQVIYADPPWDVKAGPDWGSGEESKERIRYFGSI